MNNDTQTQSTANGGACFDVSEIETEFLQALGRQCFCVTKGNCF